MFNLRKFNEFGKNVFRKYNFLRNLSTRFTEGNVEEIKIPVPWGHIAGKWWGPKNKQPILCLHGWQDNANTFNTLIPLLNPKNSYLAIDFPGHGLSSHLPKGIFYVIQEGVGIIRRCQLHFRWPKVSLMAHSFGAQCSFLFASCFPKTVDFFIGIDMLKPFSKNIARHFENASEDVEKLISYDFTSVETAPLYLEEDLIEKCVKGSQNSLTHQSAKILLERGTKEVEGQLRLTLDPKLKKDFNFGFTQKEHLTFANSVLCNVLFIKAKGSPYYDKKEHVFDVMKIVKKKAKYFEHQELEGSHHLHLNNPEIVAPVINSFMKTIGS